MPGLPDEVLLDELQFRFPLAARPYRTVARRLGCAEQELLARLVLLEKRKLLRYTGVVFDLAKLGYSSTLVALSVPSARTANAAAAINRCPQVSHNYARTGNYRLWCTLSAPSEEELRRLLDRLRKATGARELLDLRTEKVFKARALFRLSGRRVSRGGAGGRAAGGAGQVPPPAVVGALSAPFAIAARPFLGPARRLGMSERGLIALLRDLMRRGIVRRVGASVDHRRAGYRHNALVAWKIDENERERAGRRFARFAQVSHCYQRLPAAAWPYSVYTMVHGRSRKECLACIGRMAKAARAPDYRALFTVKEYKKAKQVFGGGHDKNKTGVRSGGKE